MDHVDCVVVGAGVVGLAITGALARAGRQVLCLEAAEALGAGTSGRGSGVVHAGLYYAPGSLKARLCVEGREKLYAFAELRGVPHVRRGKLVVATSGAEEAALDSLAARGRQNGVEDLRRLSAAEAAQLEPELCCAAALLSPSTGVVDAHALLDALQAEAEEHGAVTAFEAPLLATRREHAGFTLEVGGAAPMRFSCRQLVVAAGHGAPEAARAIDGLDQSLVPRGFMAKGNYFTCAVQVPFSRLIYPLPVPGGIGTHLTIGPAGRAVFGPDVQWVDTLDYAVDAARAAGFEADIRRWWKALPEGSLRPAYAGIRPKIAGPGAPDHDFVVSGESDHGITGLVALYGIESPGVTACLALGDHVAAMLPT